MLLALVLQFCLFIPAAGAMEYEASTAPDGKYVLKVFPKFYFTSAYFDDTGKARNLPDVTGLLYFELPIQVQYGVTGSLSLGAVLPIGISYMEEESRDDPRIKFGVREVWLTAQHRWLSCPVVSSFSLRLKMPLMDKAEWEDGLRIGDGQVDILPIYHFDYFNKSHFWYVQFSACYKYRFKKGNVKPLD